MLQLAIERSSAPAGVVPREVGEYGAWTRYRLPDDRSDWQPLVAQLYDYWRAVCPPGRLPGRQHIVPEDIWPVWSRSWMLDVFRNPLRYRYRLCGTEMVRSLGREVTGEWVDEVHPELIANPQSRERLRFTVETGSSTWRRGVPLWTRDPKHTLIETVIVPLASDGFTVDKMLAVSVLFDVDGRPI